MPALDTGHIIYHAHIHTYIHTTYTCPFFFNKIHFFYLSGSLLPDAAASAANDRAAVSFAHSGAGIVGPLLWRVPNNGLELPHPHRHRTRTRYSETSTYISGLGRLQAEQGGEHPLRQGPRRPARQDRTIHIHCICASRSDTH